MKPWQYAPAPIAESERTHISDLGNVSNDARVHHLEAKVTHGPKAQTVAGMREGKTATVADMSSRDDIVPTSESFSYLPHAGSLHLYGDLLHSLMVWVALYYELRLEHPGGIKLDAKPDHVTGALTRYPWGVVYTAECHVLLAWGDVPRHALTNKTELQPTAQTPVPAERVVN